MDDQNGLVMNRLEQFFTDNFSELLLKSQLENFHYHALHDELSDEWIESTLLGQRLREHNFRIMAFIERLRSVNQSTLKPTIRCSLLIRPTPVRAGRVSL